MQTHTVKETAQSPHYQHMIAFPPWHYRERHEPMMESIEKINTKESGKQLYVNIISQKNSTCASIHIDKERHDRAQPLSNGQREQYHWTYRCGPMLRHQVSIDLFECQIKTPLDQVHRVSLPLPSLDLKKNNTE